MKRFSFAKSLKMISASIELALCRYANHIYRLFIRLYLNLLTCPTGLRDVWPIKSDYKKSPHTFSASERVGYLILIEIT